MLSFDWCSFFPGYLALPARTERDVSLAKQSKQASEAWNSGAEFLHLNFSAFWQFSEWDKLTWLLQESLIF